MRKVFANIFRGLFRRLEDTEEITYKTKPSEELEQGSTLKTEEKVIKVDIEQHQNDSDNKAVEHSPRDIRDIMTLMEFPIVSLSKKRTEPIIYEKPGGSSRIKISCHTGHYIASIYDWDIILFVSSKLQETMNNSSDIPPRTLIVPRHELLKALCKHDGKKEEKDLKASLARLQLTGIETTIHNEDGRHDAGFGFLDKWGYTARKDVREFRITLSDWLYEMTCCKGALLTIDPKYFKITSGLKRFIYRTARKHVGTKNKSWLFSIETLHSKSGSEQEFKKFKYDLKRVVTDNDIPGYFTEWVREDGKEKVRFTNKTILENVCPVNSSSSHLIKMDEIRHLSQRNLLN